MIDMHTHILPGLDDGAKTMGDTIALLERASAEKITDLIATPHGYHPNFNTDLVKMKEQLKVVKEYITSQQMSINIYSGMECRLSDKIYDLLLTGNALSLAESRYVLLELPSYGVPAYIVPTIQQLISGNYVPIIAHAERNQGIIEKPERLRELVLHGAIAQVTAGSLVGGFGKKIQKTALTLIEANLIHVYGSDVHNLESRSFKFNEGLNFLEKKSHHDVIELLLENNKRILQNHQLIVLEPQDLPKQRWWNIIR